MTGSPREIKSIPGAGTARTRALQRDHAEGVSHVRPRLPSPVPLPDPPRGRPLASPLRVPPPQVGTRRYRPPVLSRRTAQDPLPDRGSPRVGLPGRAGAMTPSPYLRGTRGLAAYTGLSRNTIVRLLLQGKGPPSAIQVS